MDIIGFIPKDHILKKNIDMTGPFWQDWEWSFGHPLTHYDSHNIYSIFINDMNYVPFSMLGGFLHMWRSIRFTNCMVYGRFKLLIRSSFFLVGDLPRSPLQISTDQK